MPRTYTRPVVWKLRSVVNVLHGFGRPKAVVQQWSRKWSRLLQKWSRSGPAMVQNKLSFLGTRKCEPATSSTKSLLYRQTLWVYPRVLVFVFFQNHFRCTYRGLGSEISENAFPKISGIITVAVATEFELKKRETMSAVPQKKVRYALQHSSTEYDRIKLKS